MLWLSQRMLRAVLVICALGWTIFALAAAQTSSQKSPASQTATGSQSTSPTTQQPAADNQPKRLILKDGSYQPTVRWEIHGDRVRYLSAERFQWEELPKDMVDWKATEDYFKKFGAAPHHERTPEQVAEDEAEKKELDETSPEVAPGVRLPENGGVFLLDTYRGKPELVEVVQNSGELKRNTSSNILRAAINPLAKSKQTIELPGLKARIQAHVPDPVLYLNIDEDQGPSAGPKNGDISQRFRIVRAKVGKKSRVVGTIEFAVYSGTAQKTDMLETTAVAVGPKWIKVAPKKNLEPGEYALVEMLGKDVNLYVWDFGINPTAPENPATATPPTPTDGADQRPVLKDADKKR